VALGRFEGTVLVRCLGTLAAVPASITAVDYDLTEASALRVNPNLRLRRLQSPVRTRKDLPFAGDAYRV
jgi:hypothetical protein